VRAELRELRELPRRAVEAVFFKEVLAGRVSPRRSVTLHVNDTLEHERALLEMLVVRTYPAQVGLTMSWVASLLLWTRA
jgi:hypothetical protein